MSAASRLVENIPKIRAGARVRAPGRIYYVDDDVEVDAGAEGDVLGSSHGGAIAFIQWDTCPGIFQTSAGSIEVVS